MKELKAEKEEQRSGSAARGRKEWVHKSSLMFLKPFHDNPQTSGNFDDDRTDPEEEKEIDDREPSLSDIPPFPSASPSSSTTPMGPKQSRKRSRDTVSVDSQLLDLLKPIPVVDDEDELFMRSLVPQLKRLPDELRQQAKIRLQSVLFEYQFGRSPNMFSNVVTIIEHTPHNVPFATNAPFTNFTTMLGTHSRSLP